MLLGFVTDSVARRPLDEVLTLAAETGVDTVEIPTGNWSEAPHLDLDELRADASARDRLAKQVSSYGLTISAFNANGNQLHPTEGPAHDRVVRTSIEVAGEMGVPTVVLMSGLPGARGDSAPNWITTSWPPETLEILAYQWNEVAIPYWTDLAEFARARNVRLAIEMHGRQLVFNPVTLQRLRDAVGPDVVGANLDPSHLMWMGADILAVIRELGDAIFHVHAKDAKIEHVAAANGLLDTTPPHLPGQRSWNYVTLGLGHPDGPAFWAQFVYALRSVGYDGPLNIEHEDMRIGSEEGLRRSIDLLRPLVIRDQPDWEPARI